MPIGSKQFWRYMRGLAVPLLLWGVFLGVLFEPLRSWLRGDEKYDEAALREWIQESRIFRETLPEMVADYMDQLKANPKRDPLEDPLLRSKAEEIEEDLKALGNPPTKVYSS